MKLTSGKLYCSTEHCLILYPERRMAISARRTSPKTAAGFENLSPKDNRIVLGYWITHLSTELYLINEKQPFLFLKEDGRYIHVLAEEKTGWVINDSWLKLKEVK